MPQNGRTARLEARIAPDALELVRRAAELQGRSVSDFVVTSVQEAARRMIEETTIIRLSAEGQAAFAAALSDPPSPAEGLRKTFAAHKRLIRESQ